MTVAELVAKLQEMPQNMNVYAYDENGSHYPPEISIRKVSEWDYEQRLDNRGKPYMASIKESYREANAVIISA